MARHRRMLTRARYLDKILRLQATGALPRVGLILADVYHDRWCAHWAGRACDCDPVVRARKRG
jgi:hypothetical protein